MDSYLLFNPAIANKKPSTIDNEHQVCPFCNRERMKKENGVIFEQKKALLVHNKFPTLNKAKQMVLIEHDACGWDLSTYPKETLYSLIEFAISSWLSFEEDHQFTSVSLFKNHGMYSGASIFHPHMQIVGFEEIDYRNNIKVSDFEGITIKKSDVSLSVSTKPISELYEFNLMMRDENWKKHIPVFSNFLQQAVEYILEVLNPKFKSFNLAFYHLNDQIICKIISRGPTSIYLLGYHIHQISDYEQIANDFLEKYPN